MQLASKSFPILRKNGNHKIALLSVGNNRPAYIEQVNSLLAVLQRKLGSVLHFSVKN